MNFLNFALLLLVFDHWVSSAVISNPVVKLSTGSVEGLKVTHEGQSVNVFRRIPFAEPPVNELRFKKPLPKKSWNGIYDAKKMPIPCHQPDLNFGIGFNMNYSHASEDCLFASIWQPVPNCTKATPCSVLVFIYGGGFTFGDANLFLYNGQYFAAHTGVVYVTFNYRLGPLGFLHAGIADAPGNMGLYDQNLALWWINENIQSFGGDPKDVTLIGQSAGAVSIGYHLISPLSKGLFHRAILNSGTPLTYVSSQAFNGMGRFYTVAGIFDCYDNTKSWKSQQQEVMACLRKVNASEIIKKTREGLGHLSASTFLPVYGDEFLPVSPAYTDLELNVKDILIGSTLEEGAVFIYGFLKRAPELLSLISSNLQTVMRIMMMYFIHVPQSETRKISHAYISDEHNLTMDEMKQFMSKIIGDVLFTCPIDILSNSASKQGVNVYQYAFAHRPSYNHFPKWMGVSHGEDIPFMLGSVASKEDEIDAVVSGDSGYDEGLNPTEQELEFSKELMNTLGSFIKTGKPKIPTTNEDWPKYTKENPVFVYLQPNNYTKAKGPRTDKCPLWEPYLVKRKTTTPKPGVTTPRPKPTPSKPGKRPKSRLEPEDNFLAVSAGSCPFQSATLLLILSISMYLLKPFS